MTNVTEALSNLTRAQLVHLAKRAVVGIPDAALIAEISLAMQAEPAQELPGTENEAAGSPPLSLYVVIWRRRSGRVYALYVRSEGVPDVDRLRTDFCHLEDDGYKIDRVEEIPERRIHTLGKPSA